LEVHVTGPDVLADVEAALVGECLHRPHAARTAAGTCTPSDFADPRLGQLYGYLVGLAASGAPVDAAVVAAESERRRKGERGTRTWLTGTDIAMLASNGGCTDVVGAAKTIRSESVRRATIAVTQRAQQRCQNGDPTTDILPAAIEELRAIRDGTRGGRLTAKTLDDILALDDPYRWVVPGLLEEGDRLIVTGGEGLGKTTILRQIAVTAYAGIHPFGLHPIAPVDVLFVDCENSERQWRRKVAPLVHRARQTGSRDPGPMPLVCTGRLDLTRDADLGSVHALLDEHTPKAVVIGPLYKLVPRAITTDDDAAPLITALDSIRDRGICLLMEAHAGHAKNPAGERDFRPRGSSALLGWPEFGFGIVRSKDVEDAVDVVRWRGDRDEREWPATLVRGGHIPWVDMNASAETRARAWGRFERGEAS
jgi:replicative DNA helicase